MLVIFNHFPFFSVQQSNRKLLVKGFGQKHVHFAYHTVKNVFISSSKVTVSLLNWNEMKTSFSKAFD